MATSWRVMLSSKRWDQAKYEEYYGLYPEIRRLPQSKGGANMKVLPKRGDSVRFVYKQRVVMKGVVDSDGFEYGTYHQAHSCNIGMNRPHATSTWYSWINVTEVELDEYIKPTGQRTWIPYRDEMSVERL